MSEPIELILVGIDVRYLSVSARRAGLRVLAVDGFGDQDTADAATRLETVEAGDADALAKAALRAAQAHGGQAAIVYASGFEGRPDLLGRLARDSRLLGNGAATAALLCRPRRLFRLLDSLRIPYPEVRFAPPPDPAGWLLKHAASRGGMGVYPASASHPTSLTPDAYFQRRVEGNAISVLFAADGREARVIGFSRLFAERRAGRPYAYAGAVTQDPSDAAQRRAIVGYARRLTRALGLRGINGLDLALSDETPLLLEINARPTATLELLESQLPQGGMAAHLAACEGRLPDLGRALPDRTRGYRIIYAQQTIDIPVLDWPAWTRDRPRAGSRIGADGPLCTVHAAGNSPGEVESQLEIGSRRLLDLLHDKEMRAA